MTLASRLVEEFHLNSTNSYQVLFAEPSVEENLSVKPTNKKEGTKWEPFRLHSHTCVQGAITGAHMSPPVPPPGKPAKLQAFSTLPLAP